MLQLPEMLFYKILIIFSTSPKDCAVLSVWLYCQNSSLKIFVKWRTEYTRFIGRGKGVLYTAKDNICLYIANPGLIFRINPQK